MKIKIPFLYLSTRADLEVEALNIRAAVEFQVASGANLSRANLSGADLSRADLYGANLSGANLSGANLYGLFSFGPGGSRQAYTWARWEPEGYMVHCGCQTLTLAAFAAEVKKKHGATFHGKWYVANIATMKLVAKESEAAFRKAQAEQEKKRENPNETHR